MTTPPATAKLLRSRPNKERINSPINKKAIIIVEAAMVVLKGSILSPFSLRLIIIGRFPKMSIIENKISVTENISFQIIPQRNKL